MHAFVIHGDTGGVLARISHCPYEASLGRFVDGGFEILERAGLQPGAVTADVRMLEDDLLFNTGHGARLTREGSSELDVAIMDGRAGRECANYLTKRHDQTLTLGRGSIRCRVWFPE